MKRCTIFLFLLLLSAAHLRAQKQGKERIDSLLQEVAQAREDTGKVKLLKDISFLYSFIKTDSGIKYGQIGLDLATKLDWKKGIAGLNNSIGVNYFNRSDYPNALGYFFKTLKINEELNDKIGVAKATGNVGIVYDKEKNFPKALEYYHKSLKMAEELGNKQSMAYNNENIGSVYNEVRDYSKALQYDLEALKLFGEAGNKDGISGVTGNIAIVYKHLGNYQGALEYNLKAMVANKELGNKNGVAAMIGNRGLVYLAEAKDTTQHLSAPARIASLRNAVMYCDSAIALDKETGNLDYLLEISDSLSVAQFMLGDYKSAFKTYRQYVVIKDSIDNTESNIKITNLETQRELQLKDKQIIIDKLAVAKKRNERVFFIAGIAGMLVIIVIIFRNYKNQVATNNLLTLAKQKVEQRTEELNVTNKELNATLHDLKETQQQLIETEKQKENEMIRNRISQDIHDDISSELTRISWMSEMAKLKAGKANATDVAPLLEKITTSSRATIGKLGEIIWAVNPDNDNLENLAAYMRNYIAKFFTDTSFDYRIDFPDHVPPLPVNPELKRDLFLVMKEALNNAVKYSQARCVTVSLKLNNNTYKLTVADDGTGIDENIIRGGGNGLKNMRKRMSAVKGSCQIVSEPGKGAQVIFEGALY